MLSSLAAPKSNRYFEINSDALPHIQLTTIGKAWVAGDVATSWRAGMYMPFRKTGLSKPWISRTTFLSLSHLCSGTRWNLGSRPALR